MLVKENYSRKLLLPYLFLPLLQCGFTAFQFRRGAGETIEKWKLLTLCPKMISAKAVSS